jgi:hypothetical protein
VVTQPTTQPTPAAAGDNDEGDHGSNGLALGHQKHRNHVPPGQLRKAQNPPPRGLALGHRKHYPPGQERKAERSGDGDRHENDDDQGEDSHDSSGHHGHSDHGNNGHEHSGHGRGHGG